MPNERGVTLSRWQLGLSVECPRCFWLLKQRGIKQPEGYPLALNNAMDTLLKAEFDGYRKDGQLLHPVLGKHPTTTNAQLFRDLRKLTEWRDNKQGLRFGGPLIPQAGRFWVVRRELCGVLI